MRECKSSTNTNAPKTKAQPPKNEFLPGKHLAAPRKKIFKNCELKLLTVWTTSHTVCSYLVLGCKWDLVLNTVWSLLSFYRTRRVEVPEFPRLPKKSEYPESSFLHQFWLAVFQKRGLFQTFRLPTFFKVNIADKQRSIGMNRIHPIAHCSKQSLSCIETKIGL